MINDIFLCFPISMTPAEQSKPYRMAEGEEIYGVLHRIEKIELGQVALISKIPVLLPEELAGKLQGLIGQRIGMLRLEGYHIRCLNE
jgi:hypothetical protein